MDLASGDYEQLRRTFRWDIPQFHNLATAVLCGAPAQATALTLVDSAWNAHHFSFGWLEDQSSRLANALVSLGYPVGARIGVRLPASPEAAVAHLGILKAGMTSVPFLPDSGQTCTDRLQCARASAILTTKTLAAGDRQFRDVVASIEVLAIMDDSDDVPGSSLSAWLAGFACEFTAVATRADDAAFLAFTSGSEGKPKGVMQPHSLIPGIVPALVFTRMPGPSDIVWSALDWGWLGGLAVPLGAWHCGARVLVHSGPPLTPVKTLSLLSRFGVTRASMAPTTLRMIRLGARSSQMPPLTSITTGGEKLDEESRNWVRERFGIECSELYGLTECSGVMGSGFLVPPRDGALGKPAPGMDVRIVDSQGRDVEPGEVGTIAVRRPHPAMFSGYWEDQEATRARFVGDLFMTGDLGVKDEEGYFHFVARGDDVIKSAGNRVGPGEIEAVFRSHPAVRQCAAVGVPDALSGESIVVWIELAPGVPSEELESELMSAARERLQAYQVPTRVRIVERIPLTGTGKVRRREVKAREIRLSRQAS